MAARTSANTPLPTTSAPPAGPDENVLVVSDLHLGEDIGGPVDSLESARLAWTQREIVAFLRYYRVHREHGLPWRLVINGDFADFLAMVLMPSDAGVVAGLDADAHAFGLGTSEAGAGAKVRALMTRHPHVFRALARFLAAGNRLSMVIGNHDAEFHWPAAQRIFREALVRFGAPAVAGQITFHPWAYFRAGVWVEHGHAYDPYCVTESDLIPVAESGLTLLPNVAGLAMRYVRNHFTPHAGHADTLSFSGYLAWFFQQGATRMAGILHAYTKLSARLLLYQPMSARSRRRHLAKLRRLARRLHVPIERMAVVDALRATPITGDRRRVIRALMLDRLLLTVAVVAGLTASTLVIPWAGVGALAVVAFLGGILAHHRLSRGREPSLGRRRLSDIGRRIRHAVHAQVVVFGHTHNAMVDRDRSGWTFNTGSWVPTAHSGAARAFTHLRIVRDAAGSLSPSLNVWHDGLSRPANLPEDPAPALG